MWDDPLYIKADWVMKENQVLDAHVHESRDYPQSHRTYCAKGIEFLIFFTTFLGRTLVGMGDLLVQLAGCG